MEQTRTSRRGFLRKGMTAAAAACAGCALLGSRRPDILADPDKGLIRLSQGQSSELLKGEGSMLIGTNGSKRKILVVHLPDGKLSATSAICTHMGCTVVYQKEAGRIYCPCHGSEFGLDGNKLKGPASRPLDRYEVRNENGQVVIAV